jgi:IMP dehydrogenase/GMP reductase
MGIIDKKFDFRDITLIPETLTSIRSRSDVKIINIDGYLPIIVSPMDTVVDEHNVRLFDNADLLVCTPRGYGGNEEYHFKSISLEEFELIVQYKTIINGKLLVDIANGHLELLFNLCKKYGEINDINNLMIGNIANPKTYKKFAELGVGYIRVGIGAGSGCLTSANIGIHYPIASLIKECYEIKKHKDFETRIVADGGFRNYDEIIKALALGADYVMLGGILNKTLESCPDVKIFNKIKISKNLSLMIWEFFPKMRKFFYKDFRGMSTKDVQRKWNKSAVKTSEGIKKSNRVEYTLDQWCENFEDYLRSAMSYTNSTDLESFKDSEFVFITENALKRFEK